MSTPKPAPAREFADDQAVTFPGPIIGSGRSARVVSIPAVVESAILVGVRHPGWVYVVRLDNGAMRSLPEGVLSPVDSRLTVG